MKGGLYNRMLSALVLILLVCIGVRIASWLIGGELGVLLAILIVILLLGFLVRGRRL
jgi:hypothetical protein